MYAQTERTKENTSRAVANSAIQMQSTAKQGFGFVDNRSEAFAAKIRLPAECQSPPNEHDELGKPQLNHNQEMHYNNRVRQLKPILSDYEADDEQFASDVLSGKIIPDESKIVWEFEYGERSEADIKNGIDTNVVRLTWIIPFIGYSSQLHVHHDPCGSNPAITPTKARGHIITKDRGSKIIVNDKAIKLLDALIPKALLKSALSSYTMAKYDKYFSIHQTNPLAP